MASSEQDSADQNVLQGKHHQLRKASFLEERFVIFKLDDTLYAFPAVNVAEIGQLLPITPLPFVPSWFLGISHLRGDILSVVGLRELWQKNTAMPHKAKILIVHSEKQSLTVALVVDAVREMRHVMPEEIISDESQNDSHFAPYQIGMVDYEGQNLCLLNAEKLLETLRS
jgi:purine-binding chemotaxis protein CheW